MHQDAFTKLNFFLLPTSIFPHFSILKIGFSRLIKKGLALAKKSFALQEEEEEELTTGARRDADDVTKLKK